MRLITSKRTPRKSANASSGASPPRFQILQEPRADYVAVEIQRISQINRMHLNPARSIIQKLGGPNKVAKIAGRDISRVHRWTYPKERGGTGEVIPFEDARQLLRHAAENDFSLSPAEFFPEPTRAVPTSNAS